MKRKNLKVGTSSDLFFARKLGLGNVILLEVGGGSGHPLELVKVVIVVLGVPPEGIGSDPVGGIEVHEAGGWVVSLVGKPARQRGRTIWALQAYPHFRVHSELLFVFLVFPATKINFIFNRFLGFVIEICF